MDAVRFAEKDIFLLEMSMKNAKYEEKELDEMYVGFEIIDKSKPLDSVTVFDSEDVYDYVMEITGNEVLSIEASSWSELAELDSVFDEEKFSINVIKSKDKTILRKIGNTNHNTTEPQKRLFVDMDGTLAVFNKVDTLEKLYEPGYFFNLEPNYNVVNAIKRIKEENPDIKVQILSAYLADSRYALDEKNAWLDKYLPEIGKADRIFPPCGQNKGAFIPGGYGETDYLLDDYTKNLTLWCPPGKGIKLMNGINHTNGTWLGDSVSFAEYGNDLADKIVSIIKDGEQIQDILVEVSYSEMKEYMRAVQNSDTKEKIKGYIVYTNNSINGKENYSEQERTYSINSDNKAFTNGAAGYSIFGNCLDGKDTGVRIDLYMDDERGGKDGWQIEKCYMFKDDITKAINLENNKRKERGKCR